MGRTREAYHGVLVAWRCFLGPKYILMVDTISWDPRKGRDGDHRRTLFWSLSFVIWSFFLLLIQL
jgi:hypothetical protein